MTLQIIISTVNDTDFDDNPISYKEATVLLDDEVMNIHGAYAVATSDNDIKTAIKSKLTSLGYTWDNEI